MNTKSVNSIIENGTSLNNISSKGGSAKVSLSIVNSDNNGKRISFTSTLLEKLDNPSALQFVLSKEDGCVVIGEELRPDERKIVFSKKGSNVLYCGGIIKEITETFNLDYSDKTSQSFDNIEFDEYMDKPIAIIYFK